MSTNIEYLHVALAFTPELIATLPVGSAESVKLPSETIYLVLVVHGNNRYFDYGARGRMAIAREVDPFAGGTRAQVDDFTKVGSSEVARGSLRLASSGRRTTPSTYLARYRHALERAIDARAFTDGFRRSLTGHAWNSERDPVSAHLAAAGMGHYETDAFGDTRIAFEASQGDAALNLLAGLALRAFANAGPPRAGFTLSHGLRWHLEFLDRQRRALARRAA